MSADADQDLRDEARASSLGRLFQLLTDIFGQRKQMLSLGKIDGAEVLAVFPSLGDRCVTWKVSNCHILPYMSKSDHTAAQIVFNVPRDAIVPLLVDVIKTKANVQGLLKLLFKYVLTGKVKLKGALTTALKVIMALMVGAHPMYAEERRARSGKEEEG
ncbi:MAG: hypothetical protein JW839_08670 [Candidatus Lokiarchaeota archaeon]|nr:hypothetical protein [Candidatus Lokiarchaeota archaeon]